MWRSSKSFALLLPLLVFLAFFSWKVWAAGQFEIRVTTVDGGGGSSQGSNFTVNGTAGQPDAGTSTGGNFTLRGGFWQTSLWPTGVDAPPKPAAALELFPPAPNPFNPRTTVSFRLATTTHVRLEIHDVHGRLVKTLLNDTQNAGQHEVVWNGDDDRGRSVASGTYYLRLVADGHTLTRKAALIK